MRIRQFCGTMARVMMIAMLSFVLQEGNLDGSLQSSHPSIRIFLQGTQKGL